MIRLLQASGSLHMAKSRWRCGEILMLRIQSQGSESLKNSFEWGTRGGLYTLMPRVWKQNKLNASFNTKALLPTLLTSILFAAD